MLLRKTKSLLPGIALAMLMATSTISQARDLVIAQGIDVPGFDIHAHSTSAVEAVFINIFDYLVMRDQSGELQPSLATSWEQVGEDAIKFHLREGVVFHDGTPFTAEDVKFSIERPALDESVLQHSFYDTITGVEAVDPHTVIVRTNGPDPILLNRLSRIGSGIVPKAYVERVGWDGFSKAPIGTGPFKVTEWRRDDRIIMEAFDKHWRGRPVWDHLIHRTIPESSTRVGELISGGVDIATNIPSQDRERVDASGVANAVPWPTFRVMHLFLNAKEGSPMHDPRVREAIDLAIDNRTLVDTVMGGLGTPVRAAVTPGLSAVPMKYYNTFDYNPERAVELLKEAGYGPDHPALIKLQGPAGRYPLDVETLEIVAVMLNAVGIETEIETTEWSSFQDRVWNAHDVEGIALIGHANSLQDGYHAIQRSRCGQEYSLITGWCDPKFDELVQKSTITVNPEERNKILKEAFDLNVKSNTIIQLFQVENLIGINKNIDWKPSPDEQLWMFAAKPK